MQGSLSHASAAPLWPSVADYLFHCRLLNETFQLIASGHISPIHPIATFGFDQVSEALHHVQTGLHFGKVVISNGEDRPDVQVAIRPATRLLQLKPQVSYLIVGGLKGLCGSLAIHMARSGARRIIACSRSGISDDASTKVIMNCRAYGCEVVDAKGDVGDWDFVRRVFEEASPSIAGVIQGAMVLRVSQVQCGLVGSSCRGVVVHVCLTVSMCRKLTLRAIGQTL